MRPLLLLLTGVLASAGPLAPQASAAAIPGLRELGTIDGRTFYITPYPVFLRDARVIASRIADTLSTRAYVATVNSRAIQDALHAWTSGTIAWIGLSDEGPAGIERGIWRWDSGEPYSFSFWNPGEPNYFTNEIFGLINWGPQGEWNNAIEFVEFPAILEVYAGCPVQDGRLEAADLPADLGHAIALDWHAYAPPVAPAEYRVYRAPEICLLSAPTITLLAATPAASFVDTSVVDFQTRYYRIDVLANGSVLDSLVSGPALSFPNLAIGRIRDVTQTMELVNPARTAAVETLRVTRVSLGQVSASVATVSVSIPAGGRTAVGIASLGFLQLGDRLIIQPPDADYVIDSKTFVGEVRAIPQPNAFDEFQTGRQIRVDALIPQYAVFEGGTLFYRAGGSSAWRSDMLRNASPFDLDPLPYAIIPGSAVDTRGVEFWLRVGASGNTLTDPPETPDVHPLELRIHTTLSDTLAGPARRYRMVTLPLDFQNPSLQFADVLALHLQAYDTTRWRLFSYAPADRTNLEWSESRREANVFRAEPGRAYWLITHDPYRLDTNPVPGRSVSTAAPFQITLQQGWNQVGNPFAFPIAWSAVVRDTSVIGPPMLYDPEADNYREPSQGVLPPFAGVFVENLSDASAEIDIAAREAPPVSSAPADFAKAAAAGWTVALGVTQDAGSMDAVEVGAAAGASRDYDRNDLRKPPDHPGASISLSIDNHDFSKWPGNYVRDVRPAGEAGYEWRLRVLGSRGENSLRFSLRCSGDRPPDLHAGLIVSETGEFAELSFDESQPAPELTTRAGDQPHELRLLVGTPDYIRQVRELLPAPDVVQLDPITPNPTRRAATIHFGLPRAGPVRLEIFDLGGRLVRTLLDGRSVGSGFHARTWPATDERNVSVPSGVYFCRLTAPSQTRVRRFIILR